MGLLENQLGSAIIPSLIIGRRHCPYCFAGGFPVPLIQVLTNRGSNNNN